MNDDPCFVCGYDIPDREGATAPVYRRRDMNMDLGSPNAQTAWVGQMRLCPACSARYDGAEPDVTRQGEPCTVVRLKGPPDRTHSIMHWSRRVTLRQAAAIAVEMDMDIAQAMLESSYARIEDLPLDHLRAIVESLSRRVNTLRTLLKDETGL